MVGFREQTAAVSVGIQALIRRAAEEGTSVIIEGAHIVPGFVDLEPWQDRTLAVPVVISVDDEDLHRGHFVVRGRETPTRPVDRYQKGFANIRKVQKYIKSQALSHGVPVIPNYSLDQAIGAVIDLVIERMTGRAEGAESAERPKVARLER